MPDPSCTFDLHHSSWQRWIINPLSEAKDKTYILMDANQIHFHQTTMAIPTSLGRFISRYFILFAYNNKWACFLNLFLITGGYSWFYTKLIYRNEMGFYTLILYPETLLNPSINSTSFLVVFLGLSMYSIMSSAHSDSFTSFFPIQFYLLFFSDCYG